MNFSVANTQTMYTTHSFEWLQTQRILFDVFIFRVQAHLAFFTVSCNNVTFQQNKLTERDKSLLSNGSLPRTPHTPRLRGVLQSSTHSSNHHCWLTVLAKWFPNFLGLRPTKVAGHDYDKTRIITMDTTLVY